MWVPRQVRASLAEMLQSVGDAGHEQCGRLLSTRTKDGALLERLSSTEFVTLARLVDAFVDDCQPLTGHRATALRLVFQVRRPFQRNTSGFIQFCLVLPSFQFFI